MKKISVEGVRRLHYWGAAVFVIPLLLVVITGVLFSLRGPWVMDIKVPRDWFPGYEKPSVASVNVVHEGLDGVMWLGGADGLWQVRDSVTEAIPHFAGMDVVGIARSGDGALAIATRMAVWAQTDGVWVARARGRVKQLAEMKDGSLLAILASRSGSPERLLTSRDGIDWKPARPLLAARKQLPLAENVQVPLVQVLRDVHSGVAIFGFQGARWWSNLLGWVMVMLAVSGAWMWKQRMQRRASA